MNTSAPIRKLAYSTSDHSNIVMPAGVNLIQRRTNLKPHRRLSRVTVSPLATPVWEQQIFTPSSNIQERFGQNEEPQEYVQPSIELSTTQTNSALQIKQEQVIPSTGSLPHINPATIKPSTQEDIPSIDTTEAKTIEEPVVEEEQLQTPITTDATTENEIEYPPELAFLNEPDVKVDLTAPEAVETNAQESSTPTIENKNKRMDELKSTLQQLEENLTTIDNESMSDLSESLEQITDLRNKVQDQEQKLTKLNKGEGVDDFQNDIKAKEAILTNLEHALSNTQSDLEHLKQQPNADPALVSQIESQLVEQKRKFDQLKREHKEITNKKDAVSETPASQQSPQPAVTSQSDTTPVAAKPTPQAPRITTIPNAINGTVTTADNKLVTNAIVIVKNKEGMPLRALKTNQLGQFLITTALENGSYHIETEAPELDFDLEIVELTGDVVDPITIVAK